MRGRTEETSRTGRRKLRRLGGVALAVLLFPLLTVSPSRASCETMMLTFANVPDRRVLEIGPGTMISIVGISAHGENESWSLTFRVPDLEPGKYLIHAQEHGSTGGGGQELFFVMR